MPTLNWIGKEYVTRHAETVPFRLIHCDKDLSAGNLDSGNLIVQGDNLHALKALLPYYKGKVKCIYIDPPYNTGNEGWTYNDNVNSPEIRKWLGDTVGRDDLSRHDKWLCMMYPRLKLLLEFLSSDGAIFVSIDDNEVANLRTLMDEIFGPENFIATVIWQKIFSPKNSARHLSESHDYIMIFAANADKWTPNLLGRSERQDERYKNPDNDPRGPWTSSDLSARNYYSAGTYSITTPGGRVIAGPPKGRYWSVSEENFRRLVGENRVWFGVDKNNAPRLKRFLSEVKEGITPETLWLHTEVGNTQEAKKELIAILGENRDVFITPKPTRLIKRILQLATGSDSLILDSFAGSGTTGQAVMALNREDGGNRRFILVEMEEKIAQPVTAERVRRIIAAPKNSVDNSLPGIFAVTGGGNEDVDVPDTSSDSDDTGTVYPTEGFRFCRLGEPLFDEFGQVAEGVTDADLAHHLFFTETGQALAHRPNPNSPFIGVVNGTAVYRVHGALTEQILTTLPDADYARRIVYADVCRIAPETLEAARITFKQVPYQVRRT